MTHATVVESAAGRFSLSLEDLICFDLYAASRAVTALYRPVLERLGLTYPQYLVMIVLWERGEQSVKQLCATLHLDYGTISPLLKRLEVAGLLRRERPGDDERTVLVRLSAHGEALREQARAIPCMIGEALDLQGAELEQFRATLRRVASATLRPGGFTP